ncbi:MAG: hypothetical protein RLZZ306_139 [Bacteroidota bacterium]|jgi:hypothetical protein
MKIKSEEILKGLINVFKINKYRIEVYRKLINMIHNPELQPYFKSQIDESSAIIEELNPLMDSVENAESPLHFEDAKMNQSQFYFGMARASKNPRTVMVSCQFGDEYLVKTYKKMLEILEIKTLPYLREILTRHLNNLQIAFAQIENTLLENIPVLHKK